MLSSWRWKNQESLAQAFRVGGLNSSMGHTRSFPALLPPHPAPQLSATPLFVLLITTGSLKVDTLNYGILEGDKILIKHSLLTSYQKSREVASGQM